VKGGIFRRHKLLLPQSDLLKQAKIYTDVALNVTQQTLKPVYRSNL